MEQHRVTQKANYAGFVRERATNHAERQSLVIQVGCLVTQDAHTNRAEQVRARRIPERLVEGYGENLGGDQHHRADLQAGQLSQPAKNAIEPMAAEPRNSLAIQEASQYAAVALLLCNKKLQRRQKPWVGGKDRV